MDTQTEPRKVFSNGFAWTMTENIGAQLLFVASDALKKPSHPLTLIFSPTAPAAYDEETL